MGTGVPFSWGKARPERDADHSSPSSAEVKNEEELYLLSPHVPPWRVAGSHYLLLIILIAIDINIFFIKIDKVFYFFSLNSGNTNQENMFLLLEN
jgi:hypothetical protein